MTKAAKGEENAKKGSRRYECEEVAVISPPHAIVDPYTVMILRFDAIITRSTVMASRRPPDITRLAIFRGHIHGRVTGSG